VKVTPLSLLTTALSFWSRLPDLPSVVLERTLSDTLATPHVTVAAIGASNLAFTVLPVACID